MRRVASLRPEPYIDVHVESPRPRSGLPRSAFSRTHRLSRASRSNVIASCVCRAFEVLQVKSRDPVVEVCRRSPLPLSCLRFSANQRLHSQPSAHVSRLEARVGQRARTMPPLRRYSPVVSPIHWSIVRSASPMLPIWQWFCADSDSTNTRSVRLRAPPRSSTWRSCSL